NVFGSCFTDESCTRAARLWPALSSPQAFWPSEELPASLLKLIAAFRSRSSTRPQVSQWYVRSLRRSLSSTQPQREQVFEVGSQRLATMTRQPYQAAL